MIYHRGEKRRTQSMLESWYMCVTCVEIFYSIHCASQLAIIVAIYAAGQI